MTVEPVRSHENVPPVPKPARRLLQAYAFDPMTSRLSGRRLTIDVTYEALDPGPVGELVHVVDYDGTREQWYQPVDLDDPAILAQNGLRPSEGDPHTHQQVVYAVTMSVLERFERFLGRRFRWQRDAALVLMPHAFEGRNAFFDPDRGAVLFGYYQAQAIDPGPNLPGQWMFTCLSMDIIAHEVTHAIVHRLRRFFSLATNRDVYAWHEAFADLVALFHHFSFPGVVAEAVASSRGDLGKGQALFDLADEFGRSTGRGAALRSAIQVRDEANPENFEDIQEPHERGAVFVAAVFDAFLHTYQRRIADLQRIATGGTGVLPKGSLHPDLVARLADEAVRSSEHFLGMVVRAFDYLPVVDVTFGDVVRAIVTADRALYPDDHGQLRSTLVEALRRRGIYPPPTGIASLADDALAWPRPLRPLSFSDAPRVDFSGLITSATHDLDTAGDPGEVRSDEGSESPEVGPLMGRSEPLAKALVSWAKLHALELGFDPAFPNIALRGVHVVYRQGADGQPRPEVVVQLSQRRKDVEDKRVPDEHRIIMRAGTTVIARVDGNVDHVIAKPFPLSNPAVLDAEPDVLVREIATAYDEAGKVRLEAICKWFDDTEEQDALAAWTDEPAVRRLSFASLHAELAVSALEVSGEESNGQQANGQKANGQTAQAEPELTKEGV